MTEFNMKLDNVKIKTCSCFLSIWEKPKQDQEYCEILENGIFDGKKCICLFYKSVIKIVSFLDWLRDGDSNPNIVSDVGCIKELLYCK